MLPPLDSSQVRAAWSSYRCAPDKFTRVTFPGDGRTWELSVATPAVEAFQALAAVMSVWGYLFREAAGGTYNCRMIAGTNTYSIHSYGLAIDLNPSENPHKAPLTTDMPAGFVAAVEAIATAKTGRQVFQWGGTWSVPDAMHYQIGATPAELAQGITNPEEVDVTPEECRAIIADELDKRLMIKEGSSMVGNAVWGHKGAFFNEETEDNDNASLTLRRADNNVKKLLEQ